jgi:hypothetical protein
MSEVRQEARNVSNEVSSRQGRKGLSPGFVKSARVRTRFASVAFDSRSQP